MNHKDRNTIIVFYIAIQRKQIILNQMTKYGMIEGVMKYRIDFLLVRTCQVLIPVKIQKNKLGCAGVKLHVWLKFLRSN